MLQRINDLDEEGQMIDDNFLVWQKKGVCMNLFIYYFQTKLFCKKERRLWIFSYLPFNFITSPFKFPKLKRPLILFPELADFHLLVCLNDADQLNWGILSFLSPHQQNLVGAFQDGNEEKHDKNKEIKLHSFFNLKHQATQNSQIDKVQK